jgi:phage I-like protein
MPSARQHTSFAALFAALPAPGDGAAPEFVHLVPAGSIRTRDGRGPYRLDDAEAVIAASMADAPLPIDENHAIDLAAPAGGPSPARGWIVELQARADGVWGRVEWSETGRALLAERAYRGISPHIVTDRNGRVLAIRRASLVNAPNLTDLATLNAEQEAHNQETDMDLVKLREALALPADADEAAIVAAASAARAASQQASTHAAIIADIGKVVGAAAGADATAVLGAVRVAVDPAKVVPADQVAALQSQLAELTTSTARDKATAFVDGAIGAGRVGLKPLRDHYIARHMADPAAVEKEIGAMPSLHSSRSGSATPPAQSGDAISDEEAQVIALMGVDKDAYLKQRKALNRTEEAV